MALTETLQDNFDTDQIATLWPSSYGGPTIVNGRCRIDTNTSYNGIQTGLSYTFNNSYAFVQAFMPALNGATSQCFFELLIQSGTAGTDIDFNYDAFTGNLTMSNRVGYFDGGATTLAYNATSHAFLRLKISGGNILWDTSPDAVTWTNRRSTAASAWATSGTALAVNIQTHRSDGTNNFLEIDNFNFVPALGTPVVTERAALVRASTR